MQSALTIDIIDNLRHDSTVYLYNSFVLNRTDGPNLNGHQQDAPILASIWLYGILQIAHFLCVSSLFQFHYTWFGTFICKSTDVYCVSYLSDKTDRIVVVMYNRLEQTVPVVLTDLYLGTTDILLDPKSINTLIYWLDRLIWIPCHSKWNSYFICLNCSFTQIKRYCEMNKNCDKWNEYWIKVMIRNIFFHSSNAVHYLNGCLHGKTLLKFQYSHQ